ncbi:MAG: hypothetical protein C3F07_21370 [Anaerolineales bacterium]|nr:hypothetical protein [Anaerolineae bacterium]PWB68741.1 MAG: hypothetical protein C3F07_21370 [Anaerolineales bacterium]
MLAPVLHILPLTTIVRERTLPVAGKVNVHVDQKVNPTDVIAEAVFAREHVLLDVARTFGVSTAAADRMIKVNQGDRVTQGALIAEASGIFPRSIKAPRPGRVMVVGSGQVLMEVGDARIELRAGLPGTVTQVIPERGVVIRTAGALIQGTWGNGRIDNGLMTGLIEKPDDVLTADRLDISLRGSVILGGHVRDVDTLRAAAELPVRGLIISSMLSSLIQPAMQARFPILVLDGFGAMPMNSAAFKLLTTNNKREVTVNAEHFDRYNGNRPEVIIPLPVTNEPEEPNDYEMFSVGQQIRMRRSPHAGMLGSITNLPAGLTKLPSGLRAPAAEVKLENGSTVLVPLVNLEVVG